MAATFKLFKPLLFFEKRRLSGRLLDSWLKDSRFKSHLLNHLVFKGSYPRYIALRIINKQTHLQLNTFFINPYYIGYENSFLLLQTVYY